MRCPHTHTQRGREGLVTRTGQERVTQTESHLQVTDATDRGGPTRREPGSQLPGLASLCPSAPLLGLPVGGPNGKANTGSPVRSSSGAQPPRLGAEGRGKRNGGRTQPQDSYSGLGFLKSDAKTGLSGRQLQRPRKQLHHHTAQLLGCSFRCHPRRASPFPFSSFEIPKRD